MQETPLRIEVKPGIVVNFDGKAVVVLSPPVNSSVRVRNVATGAQLDVPIIELGALADGLGSMDRERHWSLVRDTTRSEWKIAKQRERVIRRCLSGDGTASERIVWACQCLGLSRRRVYDLLKDYSQASQTSTHVKGHRGTPPQGRRLSTAQERIVMRAIEERYLNKSRITVTRLMEDIRQRCAAAGTRAVSRNAVERRIEALEPRFVTRRRHGTKASRDAWGPVGGCYHVAEPLAVMQIDHTRVDVIAVTDGERKPLGRPWLTLAIDVATRIVLGMFVSFDAPSITSVCLTLTHACLPKSRWLEQRKITAAWDQWGLPAALHMDNAREFRSEAVRRGCDEYAIRKIFRPIARPHYGGHIERLIGTLMGRVHLLPGSTGSNVEDRGEVDPSQAATMTLSELENWLTVEITGRYHHQEHRALGMPPLVAWETAIKRGLVPSLPSGTRSFMLNFLPLQYRTLQKDGIHLFNIRFWSERLHLIGRSGDSLLVRYDPRNLARVFVLGQDGQYHDVPYSDVRHPPISIWEHRSAAAWLRSNRRKVDELGLFAAHNIQRSIESDALNSTRVARTRSSPIPSSASGAAQLVPVNYNVPAQELESEIWGSGR
jgi:putative transposase